MREEIRLKLKYLPEAVEMVATSDISLLPIEFVAKTWKSYAVLISSPDTSNLFVIKDTRFSKLIHKLDTKGQHVRRE